MMPLVHLLNNLFFLFISFLIWGVTHGSFVFFTNWFCWNVFLYGISSGVFEISHRQTNKKRSNTRSSVYVKSIFHKQNWNVTTYGWSRYYLQIPLYLKVVCNRFLDIVFCFPLSLLMRMSTITYLYSSLSQIWWIEMTHK
jgi:hypothetical protein